MIDCPKCKQREEDMTRLRMGIVSAIIGAAFIMMAYVATYGLPPILL